MIIGHTLNGAIRSTYLGVTFPFHAVGRALHRAARGIVAGIQATGRGIRSTVHIAGSAVALVFRSVINMATKVLQGILAGILSLWRAFLQSLVRTWQGVVAVPIFAARLVIWPFVTIRRTTGRLLERLSLFIRARYRALVFTMASTTMTLSLEDGYARFLVLKGDRIIAWRSGRIAEPPEEAAADLEVPSESEEKAVALVFNPLGSLLDGLPARSKQVITDLPLYFPLLRHIPLPDVKGRFLKGIVNAEVLDSVPFAQDEVDIQWRIEQGDGIREASVIAVPRDRMNDQVRMVRDSQLAPSAVYSKTTSLAAAVGLPDVFILHMTKAQTAVVLVRGGVPRIVHRLDMPEDTTEQTEAIAMGVGQVAGYHRSQHPEDDVGNLPVIVTGEVELGEEFVGLLSTTLDRPVQPIESGLECPEGFDPAEYASNIGLFLAARSKASAKVISAQNVLPERHRPRPLPVMPIAVYAGLLALVFLAFNLTGWVSNVAGELDSLNATLDIRTDQEREYSLSNARLINTDGRIASAVLESAALEANLESLEREMNILSHRIRDITVFADAENVKLSRLTPTLEGFSVFGTADSYSDVLGYAQSMRSSPNFEDATVLQVDSTGTQLGFTIEVTISTSE